MASSQSSAEWRSSFRALAHHDFRLYAIGQTISWTGGWMQGVAQSWLVYRLTKSEALLGATLFATYAPVLFFGPLGGMMADRFPRRYIVLATQTLALLQAVTMAWLTHTGQITTWHVLALAFALGTVNSFDMPARQTLFVHMVGREDLISAIALNSAVFNLSRVVGPSLAGLVVAGFGETVCFLVNAASFVAMIVCVLLMHLPTAEEGRGKGATGGVFEGFRYAWRTRELRVLLGMNGLSNLAYAPILALGPFFADGIFHRGSAGLGFFGGALGAGAVIGVLRLARHKGIGGLPHVIYWSTLFMGMSLMAFAGSQWFGFSLAVMPLAGYAIMRQNAGGNSLIQTVVPDEYRGRMMALYSMVVSGLMPIGSLASGLLAEQFGARSVVAVAGVLCLAGGLAFRLVLPGFQRWVNRQEEEVCVTL